MRYSASGVRLPKPFSATVSISVTSESLICSFSSSSRFCVVVLCSLAMISKYCMDLAKDDYVVSMDAGQPDFEIIAKEHNTTTQNLEELKNKQIKHSPGTLM